MKAATIVLISLCASLSAEPLIIKSGPFSVRPSFTANLIPDKAIPLSIAAKEWQTFAIVEIAPHGSYVEKDEVLVRFDDESFLKKLRDAESAAEAGKFTLANAEADFSSAQKYLPMQLQSAKIKAEQAAEAWEYFRNTRRDAEIKEVNLSLRMSEVRLEGEIEELKQLEKMYKADDLTENTEEIILKRQREMVKASEIGLEMAKLAHKRSLEVELPREAVTLEREATAAAISLAENEQNLPRNLELKRIALEDARVAAKRSAEALAALQAEKDLFVLKAPSSGYFYYGSMQDGRWVVGETTKALTPFAPVAVKRPFAVLVPANAKMLLETTVEESMVRALKPEIKGFASMTGRAEVSFPVTVTSVAKTPGLDGRYRVTLSAEYPSSIPLAAGMTATVQLTAYEAKSAIAVPTGALQATSDGGWEVDAGDKGKIAVKRGWTWGGKVEILSGLTSGQAIVVPEK
jgi:HlyD family secretion protein